MKPARPKRTRLRGRADSRAPQLSPEALDTVQRTLDHVFKERQLLDMALTHPSALTAPDLAKHSNQRLEFLGDRVLGLIIAERLYARRPTEREGALAPRLNRLVNKGACARAFAHIGFDQFIMLGESEARGGGREKEGILGDACEAVIGAAYLDGGLKVAQLFIERAWAPQFGTGQDAPLKDPKTALQEWVQARKLPAPLYREVARSGPDHAPKFTMSVYVEGQGDLAREGSSKQAAERAAARAMLTKLGALND